MCEAAGVRAAQESQRPHRDSLSPCCPFPPGPPRDPNCPPLPRPLAPANSDPEHENAPLALPAPDPHVECGPRGSWLAHNLWVAPSTSSHLPQISPILLSTCRSPAGAAESGGKGLPPSPIAQWDQRAWRGGTWQGWGNSQRDRRANSTLSSPALFPGGSRSTLRGPTDFLGGPGNVQSRLMRPSGKDRYVSQPINAKLCS